MRIRIASSAIYADVHFYAPVDSQVSVAAVFAVPAFGIIFVAVKI